MLPGDPYTSFSLRTNTWILQAQFFLCPFTGGRGSSPVKGCWRPVTDWASRAWPVWSSSAGVICFRLLFLSGLQAKNGCAFLNGWKSSKEGEYSVTHKNYKKFYFQCPQIHFYWNVARLTFHIIVYDCFCSTMVEASW